MTNTTDTIETLVCEVIAWRDEPRASTGWHIITVRALDDQRHTVTGCNLPRPGSRCELRGKWEHTRYGEQFWAQSVVATQPPLSAAGVARWLEDRCDGIGPVKASAILTHFADQPERLWAALDAGPDALTAIDGITPELAAHVHQVYRADGEDRQHYATLRGWRLTQAQITRVIKHWPIGEACALLHQDPYLLCEHVSGFGFKRADDVARTLGITKHDRVRLRAAVLHCLHEAAQQGHVYGDMAMFEHMSEGFLEVPLSETTGVIRELRDARRLVVDDESRVYLPALEQAERMTAEATVSALHYDRPSDVSYSEDAKRAAAEQGYRLHPEQLAAIDLVADMSRPLGFVTGGPGTGKTTILGHAVRALESQGVTVLLAAPTGKAAKRLAEATGRPASTLHRLLQYRPERGVMDCATCQQSGGGGYGDAVLGRVALIVDESSMIDLQLWAAVQRAINRGGNEAVVRYVGDADQLPPVGPGQPFQDHLRALGDAGMVVRLRAVMRQGAGSWVAESAPLVLRGAQPDLAPRPDMRFVEVQRADHVPATLEALYSGEHDAPEWSASTLAADYVPVRNWPTGVCAPVLVPQHKGPAGTAVINRVLSEHFQPPLSEGFGGDDASELVRIPLEDGTTLQQGARVMCLKNDYGKGVRNGDTGVIEQMVLERDRRGEPRPKVMVRLDADETTAREIMAARAAGDEVPDTPLVTYDWRDAREQLCLSYAMSIHKSQGSQYPWIIVVCHSTHTRMLTRRLLYTAITRASEGVVIVGNREGFMRAVQNAHETPRNTWLCQRLTAARGAA